MKVFLALFFLGSFLTYLPLHSLNYGLFAKCEGSVHISDYQIFSERCCGSNYVGFLFSHNLFPELGQYDHRPNPFGHKHFPPWYDRPIEEYSGPKEFYTLEDSDHVLFIVLFRDPYDWIRSFFQTPWYATDKLQKSTFHDFIRKPWRFDTENPDMLKQRRLNPFLDCNSDGSPFDNPFQLRKEKNKNFLHLKDKVSNIYYANYEVFRDHPKEVIDEISELFGIEKTPEFVGVRDYKGSIEQGKYLPKRYFTITEEDLQFINNQLDESLEAMIGYSIQNN